MKILSFLSKKTKVDEQIDEMQLSVSEQISLRVERMKRKATRSLDVLEKNGGKPELVKRDLIDILLEIDELKNLASDLKSDARL